MTGSVWSPNNFVVEDLKVKCQSQSNRIGRLHFRLGTLKRVLVRLLGIFQYSCSGITSGNFCKISVIISLHFKVENFRFWTGGFGNKEFIEETKDILTDIS